MNISNIIQKPIEKVDKKLISKSLDFDEKPSETLRLTKSFNEKFKKTTNCNITITPLSIIKDDIFNYRPLSDFQLAQIATFTKEEILDIIKSYNTTLESIQALV